MRRRIAAALAALAALGAACAGGPSPPATRGAGGSGLVPTQEIAGNFLMRQQLAFRAGEERGHFEALVQKHCDELIVVGLSPFGSRAFTLRQRGVDVEVETHIDVAWPFPPRRVLQDVHRVYLLPLADPPLADGVHESVWGDEVVSERWSSGRLRERRLRRSDGAPPGDVVVRYEDGASAEHPPVRVRVVNERFGYVLDVTTVERRPLTCP